MTSIFIQVFAVSAIAFMSTNTDNLIIYTGFLSSKQGPKASMVLSYYLAMTILLVIIFFLSLFFSKIPPADIKYLGIFLSCAGIFLLAKHLLRKGSPSHHVHFASRNLELMLGVTMLLDSFDTISVFVPLFADSNDSSDLAVGGSFVCCFIIWGLTGLYISRLMIFRFLTKHRDIITPIIVILVGFYIFLNTAGDVE